MRAGGCSTPCARWNMWDPAQGDVRDALRTVLVTGRHDLPRFDRAFDRFWRVWPERVTRACRSRFSRRAAAWRRFSGWRPRRCRRKTGGEAAQEAPDTVRTYSADDRGARRISPHTRRTNWRARAPSSLAWHGRRASASRGAGSPARGVVDPRRLLRVNARLGGEPIVIPRRERRRVPRPLVVLCDVSGSMEPYTRMLLLFVHAMARRRRRSRCSCFPRG